MAKLLVAVSLVLFVLAFLAGYSVVVALDLLRELSRGLRDIAAAGYSAARELASQTELAAKGWERAERRESLGTEPPDEGPEQLYQVEVFCRSCEWVAFEPGPGDYPASTPCPICGEPICLQIIKAPAEAEGGAP